MAGPLTGVSVVEFAGRGPGPFASMLLADMGASVTTIERREGQRHASDGHNLLLRGRRSIAIDLRKAAGAAIALDLVERADVLVEGHRPGVMERNRNTFVEIDGVAQPAPAPRFSRTQPRVRWGPVPVGAHTEEILQELGRGADEIEELSRDGVVRLAQKTMPARK